MLDLKKYAFAFATAGMFLVSPPPVFAQNTPLPSPEAQEVKADNENELINSIQAIILQRMKDTYPEGTTTKRDAHPKTHGLTRARLVVEPRLPEEFRQGIFAQEGEYDALVRFSSAIQQVSPDLVQQPHGMAVKVLGVEGPKLLEGHKDATTQDFVMINHPVFFMARLDQYLDLFSAQVGKPELLDAFAKNNPEVVEIVARMIAEEFYNPLAVQYWSQTAYKFGDHAAKYTMRPLSGASNTRPDQMLPDYFRTTMIDTMNSGEVRFEFLVQLQKDVDKQPVENPTVEWDPADTQPIRVATLIIPKQDISAPENLAVAERLSFSVWHSLEDHRPLGAINRARRPIYKAGSELRWERNGISERTEPTEIPEW